MSILFTSDTHFNHYNIIKYCNRPFKSTEEMNQKIIDNWNSVVGKNDTVYHLGDFCFGSPKEIRKMLNGRIHLILGNHDRNIKKKKEYLNVFESVQNTNTIYINGNPIFLSHYAHRVWDRSHYGTIHLYGHSHGKLGPHYNSIDVGVDCNNFFPLSYEQIIDKINQNNVDFKNINMI